MLMLSETYAPDRVFSNPDVNPHQMTAFSALVVVFRIEAVNNVRSHPVFLFVTALIIYIVVQNNSRNFSTVWVPNVSG